MQFPNLLVVLSVIALAVSPALSLGRKDLKQATRSDVVKRQLHPRALQPRQSPGPYPCQIPATDDVPSPVKPTVGNPVPYTLWFSGSGVTENWDNPGTVEAPNPTYPLVVEDIGYFNDVATAAQTCANDAATDLVPLSDAWSFNLYFLLSECTWICTQFANTQYSYPADTANPAYFNVVNPDAIFSYGYAYNDI